MAVSYDTCEICKKGMVDKVSNVFPLYFRMNQEAQIKRAGFAFKSKFEHNNKKICQECVDENKATFTCELCNEQKGTDKIEFSIGNPSSFLCSDCCNTVTAKVWNAKIDELEEDHKYDFC